MKQRLHTLSIRVAVAFAAAILLFSCKEPEPAAFDFEMVPVQVVHDMNILQTDKGAAEMRMHAPLMQRFHFVKDSVEQSYELYSDGFYLDAYTEDYGFDLTNDVYCQVYRGLNAADVVCNLDLSHLQFCLR